MTEPGSQPADKPHRLRQVLALVVAVLLVAAFVLYRTGVIGDHFLSGSKSTFVFVGGQPIKPPGDPTPTLTQPPTSPANSGG